ncbi:hypothetical protein V5E97_01920 [Singulisphaera sp. Ch08]|uniref:DUF3566 domain-containing protein n=1 Tax=Singulisphaera sp. Ch08 TaxID=3120278 RepID=A0AAU7CI18_9BACT
MPDPSSDEAMMAWIDNPYRSHDAPLVPVSRKSLILPLRWSFIGTAIGGCLGVVAVLVMALVVLNVPATAGESDEVGPMLVAALPALAIGFVLACAVVGLFVGLLMGTITCMMVRPSQYAFDDRTAQGFDR